MATRARRLGPLLGARRCALASVCIADIADPTLPEESRKYTFEMDSRLRSTTRGRQNKLEFISMATRSRSTGEVEQIHMAHEHSRPLYFSPVRSFES